MNNPFTLYEQEVMSALYKSLNYCEEYDLPTYEITKALNHIESKLHNKEVGYEGFYSMARPIWALETLHNDPSSSKCL